MFFNAQLTAWAEEEKKKKKEEEKEDDDDNGHDDEDDGNSDDVEEEPEGNGELGETVREEDEREEQWQQGPTYYEGEGVWKVILSAVTDCVLISQRARSSRMITLYKNVSVNCDLIYPFRVLDQVSDKTYGNYPLWKEAVLYRLRGIIIMIEWYNHTEWSRTSTNKHAHTPTHWEILTQERNVTTRSVIEFWCSLRYWNTVIVM